MGVRVGGGRKLNSLLVEKRVYHNEKCWTFQPIQSMKAYKSLTEYFSGFCLKIAFCECA